MCCQQLTISSEGMANEKQRSSMGDYHYYGNDPDGARIYHNPKRNKFITKDHVMNIWIVS